MSLSFLLLAALAAFPKWSEPRAVTSGPHDHLLASYFAIDSWSPNRRYMLVLETDVNGRLPEANERCTLGVVDLEDGNRFIPVTTTACWNFQEAAMAFWMDDDTILFNDVRDGKFKTVVMNWREKRDIRVLPRPVSAVSEDRTWAVSVNYARLSLLRPDYGYAGPGQDPLETVEWPENDGLWTMDLKTGESKLILSVAATRSQQPQPKHVAGKPGQPLAYHCHTVISKDGAKIFFLARSVDWFDKKTHKIPYWNTTSFTVNRDGTELRRCFKDGWAGSHFNWAPDGSHKMLVTATWNDRHDPKATGHAWSTVEFEVGKEEQVRRIGAGILDADWHCIYSPDGKFMSGETYWNKYNERPWVLVRLEDGMTMPMGSFFVPEKYRQTYWRCDLHARYRPDGRQIAFNSVHEGSRQVYVRDITPADEADRASAAPKGYPIRFAGLSDVRLTDGFWFDRLETNRTATLRSCWTKCAETPRLANFTNAACRAFGTFGGIPFDDSDVFKVMEGTAYVLAAHPDPELEAKMTWLIGEIAKAQEPDGYLYTARTLGHYALNYGKDLGKARATMMGPTRWSRTHTSHELYNVGHLYEAAVAWKRVTGRDDLLRVAEKNAELVRRTFGPDENQLKNVAGHEEIELALVKLAETTGKSGFFDLAKHFIDRKGLGDKSTMNVFTLEGDLEKSNEMSLPGAYCQNHLPFVRQREAVGHAVRAAYLYCGATDVAAKTGDADYRTAIDAIWENVVSRKLHLTGGIGARPKGEAFGLDYELPNDMYSSKDSVKGKDYTYLETCAAIGNALWNARLFKLTGETKYMDVLERVIYNGFVSGISLSGDEYFYPNPLASKGGYTRSKWFGCSCCPVNDVRFIPQIPSFAYATDGSDVYVNLFLAGEAEIAGLKLKVETGYPWNGRVKIAVLAADGRGERAIRVRVPGWARGNPVPSDLYVQTEPAAFANENGYRVFRRAWAAGDTIELDFPMPVRRIRAHAEVAADRGRLAVEKGPIVYCAEGVDNGGKAYDAVLPADATFEETTIAIGDKTFPALKTSNGLKLIPYCLWGNREPGNELQVWFKE